MDKIREEFEKVWLKVEEEEVLDFRISFIDGNYLPNSNASRFDFDLADDINKAWTIYKSRDEEIKEQKRIIQLGRDLLDQQYMEFKSKNKKLRDALGKIVDYVNVTRAEDAFNMQRIAKEALKEN